LAKFDDLREHMITSSKAEISKQSWADSVDQLMLLYENVVTRKAINV